MKYIYKFNAMSTPCELILYFHEKKVADSLAESVVLEVKRLEKKYNYYSENSYLSLLNKREENRLDKESKNLLQRAKKYYTLTNGIFDITVATLKPLFNSEKSLHNFEDKRKELLPYVGCEHFEIKKDKLYFDNEFTKIDLGGFVKEYAVDHAAMIIQKKKIKSALINFGGDIYAIGKKPDGERFSIGIKDPKDPQRFIEYIEIEDEALTTSASYERNYYIEDENFSHIISKDSTKKMASSVSVISLNCIESGVYSTSLMVDSSLEHKNRALIY